MDIGMHKAAIIVVLGVIMGGCANTEVINPTAPKVEPHYIDTEVANLSKQLIDEQRHLANIREAKQKSQENPSKHNVALPSGAIMSGLETKRTLQCQGCDVKIVLEAVAGLLGWNTQNVYEIGRKPAQGLPTNINIRNEPLMRVLEQIKADTGHAADIRIDPNFKTILIEYRSLVPNAVVN